jgi:hypothetical protein
LILTPGVGGFPSIGLRVVIVFAFQGLRHSAAPVEAEGSTGRPVSVRAAMMCILTLSVFGWTVILLPLWAITQ